VRLWLRLGLKNWLRLRLWRGLELGLGLPRLSLEQLVDLATDSLGDVTPLPK